MDIGKSITMLVLAFVAIKVLIELSLEFVGVDTEGMDPIPAMLVTILSWGVPTLVGVGIFRRVTKQSGAGG